MPAATGIELISKRPSINSPSFGRSGPAESDKRDPLKKAVLEGNAVCAMENQKDNPFNSLLDADHEEAMSKP